MITASWHEKLPFLTQVKWNSRRTVNGKRTLASQPKSHFKDVKF